MMATSNGAGGPKPQLGLSLSELTPERMKIPVEGRPTPLRAWVLKNGRYPAEVAGELEDARNDYQAMRERVWDGPPPPDFIESVRALLRDCPEDGTMPSSATFAKHVETLRASLKTYDEVPKFKSSTRQWEQYLTRCLVTLIPGLEDWEASLIPADKRLSWLFEFGLFTDAPTEQEAPASGPPESKVEEPATATASPPASTGRARERASRSSTT